MGELLAKLYLLPASVRYFFVSLVCAVIAVLLYCQDILPLYHELNAATDHEKQLTQTLQKLYYQETTLEEKMPQLPATKAVLNEWQKEFIKRADVNKLVKIIITTGKKDKLVILLAQSGAIVKENNYLRQPFTFVLRGDYSHISEFIKQIANLPWLVVVNRFTLSQISAELFSADVELGVYYLK